MAQVAAVSAVLDSGSLVQGESSEEGREPDRSDRTRQTELTDSLRAELRKEISDSLRAELRQEVSDSLRVELRREIADSIQASLHSEGAATAALRAELTTLRSMVAADKAPMKTDVDKVDVEVVGIEREANLYSFVIESSIDAFARPQPVGALCWTLFHLWTMLVALLTVQSLYTYGYCDASMFLGVRGTFTGFQEVVDASLFYSTSLVFGQKVAAIKALCAVAALFMLSLQVSRLTCFAGLNLHDPLASACSVCSSGWTMTPLFVRPARSLTSFCAPRRRTSIKVAPRRTRPVLQSPACSFRRVSGCARW
jgi:hypothetical protein